jgi:hypothetical protein
VAGLQQQLQPENKKTRKGKTAMTEIRDVYSRITGKIIADLEQGIRPWHRPWNADHATGRITRPEDTKPLAEPSRNKPPSLAEDLYFQANVNLISAVAFFGVEDLYKSKVPSALLEKAIQFVRPRFERFPAHLALDWQICEWLQSEEDHAKASLAKTILAKCDRILDANDGGKSLTRLDAEIIQRYRKHLASRQNAAIR